jgi:hypothetical protein
MSAGPEAVFRADLDTGAEIFKIGKFYKTCPFYSYGAGKTIPVTIRAARFSFGNREFSGALHPRAALVFIAAALLY